MHGTPPGNGHKRRMLLGRQWPGHRQLNFDLVQQSILRFTIFAVFGMDARVSKRDRNVFERPFSLARVETDRHGSTRAQSGEKIIVGIGSSAAAANIRWFVGLEMMRAHADVLQKRFRIAAHDDMKIIRCLFNFCGIGSTHKQTLTASRLSILNQTNERISILPNDEKEENAHNKSHGQPRSIHKNVEKENVNNDRAEKGQAERDEASDDQEQPADDLAQGNGI